ncbi:MAG: pseudouridine synthase [Promethearchaeota archaeon]|nr:MAG: pseudouridine synthase [Candidatus Lokiarchaeota archaeon]
MEIAFLLGLRQIKAVSDYQFGKGITDILFEDIEHIHFERSLNTNKIRYIYYKNNLLLTLRPTNGFFTLTLYSAKKIIEKISPPKLRVIVLNDISEYIKKGRNVFCKHVIEIDKDLRPLDEVIVVNQDDELLGIGKLKIPVSYVKSFSHGVAVNIRKGINKSKI